MDILYPAAKKINQRGVVSPQVYARYMARGMVLPPRAVLCPLPWLTHYVLSQAKYETKHLLGEVYIDTKKDFCFIALAGCGAPAAALQTELAIACGVKKCIFLGTAGSLQEEVQPGDIVLCQQAVGADGTSPHYHARPVIMPQAHLTATFGRQLAADKKNFHTGRIWTTDAVFCETKAEVKHYQRQRVLGVDMETAAFLAVCRRRKVGGAAVLVISDALYKGVWEPSLKLKEIAGELKSCFDSARKTLLQE